MLLEELLQPGHGGPAQGQRLLNCIGWGGPATKDPTAIRVGVLGASQVRAAAHGSYCPRVSRLAADSAAHFRAAYTVQQQQEYRPAEKASTGDYPPLFNTLPLPLRAAAGGHLCPHLACQAALRRGGGSRGSAGRRPGPQVRKAAWVSALLRVQHRVCAAGVAWLPAKQAAAQLSTASCSVGSRQPPLRRRLQLPAHTQPPKNQPTLAWVRSA